MASLSLGRPRPSPSHQKADEPTKSKFEKRAAEDEKCFQEEMVVYLQDRSIPEKAGEEGENDDEDEDMGWKRHWGFPTHNEIWLSRHQIQTVMEDVPI